MSDICAVRFFVTLFLRMTDLQVRCAPHKPPLCKGRCRTEFGGGVVFSLDDNPPVRCADSPLCTRGPRAKTRQLLRLPLAFPTSSSQRPHKVRLPSFPPSAKTAAASCDRRESPEGARPLPQQTARRVAPCWVCRGHPRVRRCSPQVLSPCLPLSSSRPAYRSLPPLAKAHSFRRSSSPPTNRVPLRAPLGSPGDPGVRCWKISGLFPSPSPRGEGGERSEPDEVSTPRQTSAQRVILRE